MEQPKYTIVEADHNKGVVDDCDLVGSFSSSSSFESESAISRGSSLDSDSFEEVTSPASSSSSSDYHLATEPLNDMSSLFQQLPIKRGLSMYYQGKAQSFTSLAKVKSLEDLEKPENPYSKKLKTCRSHGEKLGERQRGKCTSQLPCSRGSCSSLGTKTKRDSDHSFMGTTIRPPIPPHRSTRSITIPNQTPLFA